MSQPTDKPLPDPRYARHEALSLIGAAGQKKLLEKTVLVLGCGSLGSAQAMLLARAGAGRLIVADRDIVELCNLPTQILYDEQDVRDRLPKAEAAARRLRAINPGISVEAVVADVTAANVSELIGKSDLVMDGSDNFEARYLLNDGAVKAGKPWVYGGVLGTGGMVMAVRPGGPCLRCLFEEPPDMGALPTCDTFGVLNAAAVWVASLQVSEALKCLLAPAPAEHRLHILDIIAGTVSAEAAERRGDCPCCGRREFEFLDSRRGSSSSSVLCGRNAVQVTPERRLKPDFAMLQERLKPLGSVAYNGAVLEFTSGENRLVVFPDGRVLVFGTKDTAVARGLVSRFIGS